MSPSNNIGNKLNYIYVQNWVFTIYEMERIEAGLVSIIAFSSHFISL